MGKWPAALVIMEVSAIFGLAYWMGGWGGIIGIGLLMGLLLLIMWPMVNPGWGWIDGEGKK